MGKIKELQIDPEFNEDYIDESTAPETDVFEFNEKAHYYTLNGRRMYGITSVLGIIAKPLLIPWAAGQVVEYIRNNAKKQTIQGSNWYAVDNKLLEQAKIAHRMKKEAAGDVGKVVHGLAEDFANGSLGKPIDGGSFIVIPPEVTAIGAKLEATPEEVMVVTMFNHFLKWAMDNKVTFLASEQKMYSKTHWIAGTVDAVVMIGGKKYVMDIKTYSGIYDRTPFLQMAGYAIMLEEMGHKDIHGTIIVRLGKDGSFEVVKNTNLAEEKQGFLHALGLYKIMQAYKPKKKF